MQLNWCFMVGNMKLYVFKTNMWAGKHDLSVEEFDVEEKNKIYTTKYRRFNKSDVGVASGYSNNECILLENNKSKAASILVEAKERELEVIQERLNRKINEIEELKKYIN